MNQESQHIEWKERWKDDYLKWIAGFANAKGGVLYIGKDDHGQAVGLTDVNRLLVDVPNKVKAILGIVVEVNLLDENGHTLMEIVVPPYDYPISYKGEYHYRSGSTRQQLTGAALTRFLLKKSGQKWDGVPAPSVSIDALSEEAFASFTQMAGKANRVPTDLLEAESRVLLLENLRLLDEQQVLKRAAVLLFHPDPERFVAGAYIKIGFFDTDADLRYQDEVHGHLFHQVQQTLDLLLTKYLSAYISYEGISRVERYPYPVLALREALLNAIAHKDYSSGIPIQIRVYRDKLAIWNEVQLPETWTLDTLLSQHPSKPANPDLANTFFRAGMIEAWGRGIAKMLDLCQEANLSRPAFSNEFGGLMLTFVGDPAMSEKVSGEMSGEMSGEIDEKIMTRLRNFPETTLPELAKLLGVSTRTIERHIQKLKAQDQVRRTGSTKAGRWEVLDLNS